MYMESIIQHIGESQQIGERNYLISAVFLVFSEVEFGTGKGKRDSC